MALKRPTAIQHASSHRSSEVLHGMALLRPGQHSRQVRHLRSSISSSVCENDVRDTSGTETSSGDDFASMCSTICAAFLHGRQE